jgi:hypothetical protein
VELRRFGDQPSRAFGSVRQLYAGGNTIEYVRLGQAAGVTPRGSHGTAVGAVLATPGDPGGTSEWVNSRGRRSQAAQRSGNEDALKTLIDRAAGHGTGRRELLDAIVTAGSPVLMPLMRSFEKLPLQVDDHLRMGMIVARLAERACATSARRVGALRSRCNLASLLHARIDRPVDKRQASHPLSRPPSSCFTPPAAPKASGRSTT